MKDENVEREIRSEMTNEHVGNTSIIKCILYFNGIEYAELRFYLCFYDFDLYTSRQFWRLFFPKSTLWLISE